MTTTQNLPALPDNFGTGLEDMQASDAVIPRLTIAHKEGKFEDNLSGEQFGVVNLVILGLVKQRVLWSPTVDDGDAPMCKSTDNITGFPNDDAPKDKRFPWAKSGFDKNDYPEDSDGLRNLPCSGCQLKEWGTHPNGKSPWCTEQWTLPVMYDGQDYDGNFSGVYSPAIFTLQRSGVKAIRAYLTNFQRTGQPAFVNIAQCKLEVNTRGDVTYSTPKFSRVGATDQGEWPSYATQFMQIREYLTRRPVNDDAEPVEAGQNNVNTAPAQAAPAQVAPAPQQQAAPAPQQAAQAAPEAAPAQAAPAPQQQAAQAPAQTPPAAADDDEDLPF